MKDHEKSILKLLFESSQGLYTFTLYQRLRLTPKEMFIAIEGLQNLNLISNEDDKITLTEEGKKLTMKGRSNNINNKHKSIPKNFLGPRKEINEFYLPIVDNSKS